MSNERIVPSAISNEQLANTQVLHLARYNFAAGLAAGKKVLDAGCGSGYGTALLAEKGARNIIGIDISAEEIQYANQHYQQKNLSFKTMDTQKLDFPAESFHLVLAIELIEHLNNPKEFLKGVRHILKKDGLMVASTPNKAKQSSPRGELSSLYHTREYNLEELKELLKPYFSKVEILAEAINNGEFNKYRQKANRWFWKIPLFIRKFIPATVAKLIRWIVLGREPGLRLSDIDYSSNNPEQASTFLVKCCK